MAAGLLVVGPHAWGGGLSADGNQLVHQDSLGIADAAEPFDLFGDSVARGDFNGDGIDDLAVGVLDEAIDGISSAGAVNVLYGTAAGLTATGNQLWHQDSAGIADAAEANDRFGRFVAAGDFNGDGIDDLAVGAPGEAIDGISSAGAVNVLYGTAARMTATTNQ